MATMVTVIISVVSKELMNDLPKHGAVVGATVVTPETVKQWVFAKGYG